MNGLGVYDFIIRDQYDPSTGETYQAMTSCNNEEMAARCKVKGANKVVWCIKANADFNNNAANALRSAFKNGTIDILSTVFDAEETLKKIPGWSKLSYTEQSRIQMPYLQTDLLINEMINLEHSLVNNKVKLKERSGMRKDRFSSMEYNNYVVGIISNELKPKNIEQDIINMLTIRPAKKAGHF